MKLIKSYYKIETPLDKDKVFKTVERYGRVCYKSEYRITEPSADRFVRRRIRDKHWGLFEHIVCTVRFVVNRGFTHELVRHRLVSYLQESTRYCNYAKGEVTFIIPFWVNIVEGEYHCSHCLSGGDMLKYEIDYGMKRWFESMRDAEDLYIRLVRDGEWSPEQARGVLPIDLKTEIITTANLRQWRHIFRLRTSGKAHPQMREIMVPLLEDFREMIPYLYDSLEE